MSKASKVASGLRKAVEKVNHGNRMKTNIPAGMALPGPPLGPMLGQHGVNIAAFCRDFNEKTKHIKEGIPLPTRVKVNADRTYQIVFHQPPVSYFLKQAAGIQRAAMDQGKEVAGKVTLKHIYEIAKIKSQDPTMECREMEDICRLVIGTARSCGIQVVRDLDPEEYRVFLQERKLINEQQRKELDEKREAKLLRT